MDKKNMSNKNLKKVSGGANVLRSDNETWDIMCTKCQTLIDSGFRTEEEARKRLQELNNMGKKCPNCKFNHFAIRPFYPYV